MKKKKKISRNLLKTIDFGPSVSSKISLYKNINQYGIKSLLLGPNINFVSKLRFEGIGIRIDSVKDGLLIMRLGFSHLVQLKIPASIAVFSPNKTTLVLSCENHLTLTQFIATIKSKKSLNSYKGFGIRGFNEVLNLKEFKKK